VKVEIEVKTVKTSKNMCTRMLSDQKEEKEGRCYLSRDGDKHECLF